MGRGLSRLRWSGLNYERMQRAWLLGLLEAAMRGRVVQAAVWWAKWALSSWALIGTLGWSCPQALHASTAERSCSASTYHQFDFWIGDWDVFEEGGSVEEAHATVTRVQDGCGLRELYSGKDGSGGESLSMYDPAIAEWQQTWVSNRGQIVVIHGDLQGQRMVLSGTDHGPTSQRLVRGVWQPEKNGVRETAERSSDGGKTWTPWFDLSFRPHVSSR
jgi:hypothetical protein